MYKMVLENEHAQGIINGLHEIAGVRGYDLWVLGVALLAVIVSGLAAYFAYRLNQKQSTILEQQNRIALFDKRHELYTVWSQFYYGAKNLEDFLKKYNKEIIGNYKKELFIKSANFLFPKSSFSIDISEYERSLYDHIVKEGLYRGHTPQDKDFTIFIDFESIGVDVCEASRHELYSKVTIEFNEQIYNLKKIPKLFSLKSKVELINIFNKIKLIQESLYSNDFDFFSTQNLFTELIFEIRNSKIKDEMFEQIVIINE